MDYLSNDSPWKKDSSPFIIGDCTRIFLQFEVLEVCGGEALINVSITFINATIEGNHLCE
ncbi:hypothetical protein [Thermococcus piezophilus]|uniref:Uncharacterized protein n=1 Tax=Thermococcus piezophilus TaxID=1712654 RepID=A0A172WJ48_9EURY|nr:hypothetical protein [Thermococcus piezophilus]ANF23488.1 hypothetical protein A7C91_10210 [Thermococcus piezophilus]